MLIKKRGILVAKLIDLLEFHIHYYVRFILGRELRFDSRKIFRILDN